MNKKVIKRIGLIIGIIIVMGGVYGASQFFMPHRDVQSVKAFVEISAKQLVDEYLVDKNVANQKYLDAEGESKVIIVKGVIKSIEVDQNNQKVLVLKSNNDKLGVSCKKLKKTNF